MCFKEAEACRALSSCFLENDWRHVRVNEDRTIEVIARVQVREDGGLF